MTDRELLELAAKAAGLKIIKWGESDYYSHRDGEVAYVCATGQNDPWGDEWQPLNDDGDALRLAVKLCLDVFFGYDGDGNIVSVNANWDGAPAEVIQEIFDQDGVKATRRAIVRAAAEIGRAME